ncbi:acyl-CoA dehydrogenase family protein [Paraburkholderia phymatum]|uniref:acyl-CoA dehydrogenase family protein n=1 Tax=Paraburkholderia phymatum TaxID=148447 RepID=UPI00318101F9
MDQLLTDAFEQFLADRCGPQTVRRIEDGEAPVALWKDIHESGFIDALVPVERDGAGLGWRDATGLVLLCGRYAVPLPAAHTLLARAALACANAEIPTGPITIADRVRIGPGGAISASAVQFGQTSSWVWSKVDGTDCLLPTADAERQRSGGNGSLSADLHWKRFPATGLRFTGTCDLRAAGAAITAALLAGAMERAGELTIGYANERIQFGKAIGKLQAIQQQLSVLCEQMYAARTAALIGLTSADHTIDSLRAATAKSRASEAAVTVAAVSHAVHGAIGVTEEYDLQLFTRRLHDWRRDYGSEGFWNARLGSALLAERQTPLEFVRTRIAPDA